MIKKIFIENIKKYSIKDNNKKFEKRLIREGKFILLNIWNNSNDEDFSIDLKKVYCVLIKKK